MRNRSKAIRLGMLVTAAILAAGNEAQGQIVPRPAPAPPRGLTATAIDATSVALAWRAPITGASGYAVFRGPGANGPWTQLTPTAITATAYTDRGPMAQTTYAYYVVATGRYGSAAAQPVKVTTPARLPLPSPVPPIDTSRVRLGDPPKPVGASQESPLQVRIDWGCPAGAISYHVHVSIGTGGARAPVGTVSGECHIRRIANPIKLAERYAAMTENRSPESGYASLPDSITLRSSSVVHTSNFTPGTVYAYTVQALYPDRTHGWGGPALFRIPLPAPTNFRATLQSPRTVELTWDGVANASGYRLTRALYRGATYGAEEELSSACLTQTGYIDAGLSPGSYRYRISTCPDNKSNTITISVPCTWEGFHR